MEKMVYKFLDEYLGDEVSCKKTRVTDRYDTYNILSKKNKSIIMIFRVHRKEGDIVIFRSDRLNYTVSSFFDLEPKIGMSIIRDWFGNKHDINKVKDLIKFIN